MTVKRSEHPNYGPMVRETKRLADALRERTTVFHSEMAVWIWGDPDIRSSKNLTEFQEHTDYIREQRDHLRELLEVRYGVVAINVTAYCGQHHPQPVDPDAPDARDIASKCAVYGGGHKGEAWRLVSQNDAVTRRDCGLTQVVGSKRIKNRRELIARAEEVQQIDTTEASRLLGPYQEDEG